ncbi:MULTISPECIES: hypothetical protein [Candidatus Accumulibacter]|uniref:Ankyrin repeat domain-containing protein n=1 Tax=Candidatus Accumulibacter cognatus TaxID=2954383 RepID=A0A080MGK3_9PROT|nr:MULTISPECIES: hypothetical protein [Candidatus Accumulibacter]KFB76379.1 MAG: hypothetical protein AW06_002522 [Candidatus Accumulibacter cognatus]
MPHPGYTVPHSSDDDAPLRLLETHPAFARASERIAEHTAPPARRKPLRHPDQALLSTARAADLPRLREALRAGANVNAVETTSRSIGIHGRAQGPRRSALQLALMARGRTWVDCAHALITAGSDPLYSNRWGETPGQLLRDRLAKARLPDRHFRLYCDYVLQKILRPAKDTTHWFDAASRALFTKLRSGRP